MYHLYLDDSATEGFTKLAQSTDLVVIMHKSCIAMYDKDDSVKTKRVFGIKEDKLFQLLLMKNEKVCYVDGVCVYERDDFWYTVGFDNNDCQCEIPLGKKHKQIVPFPATMKYGRLTWTYFMLETDSGIQIVFFDKDGGYHEFGPCYEDVVLYGQAVLYAKRCDKHFDIITPNGMLTGGKNELKPVAKVKNSKEEVGVFVWSEKHNGWAFYEGYSSLGENALVNGSGNNAVLWSVGDEGITPVAHGEISWEANLTRLYVGTKVYSVNPETGIIDFDNPITELTFFEKLKFLFR